MCSWLELLFNVIGYGGFVVLASRQPDDAAAGRGVSNEASFPR